MLPERYITIDRLAVGGMGEVFLARQEAAGGFRRTVVLKRLLPDAEGNDEAVGRLLDEARIVAALSHENVVSIIEIGEKRGANEAPFLALEYVHGENCGTLRVRAYKRGVEMPVVVAARIVADVARGLHHAHVAKDVAGMPLHIVHRDVAPKNILVRHDGVSKITDFGIAWAQDRLSRTATGNVAGTLTYMSPEQVAGKAVDGRSDQFALGVVLWELLACKRLFKADTPMATVERILAEKLEPPSHHRPEVPHALDAIALRMLSREPNERFASCDEAAAEIERAMPDASTSAGRAAVGTFLDRVVGDDLRERQKRIESGVAHPAYASASGADTTLTRSVTSSVDSVRRQRAGESELRATQTPATSNASAVVALRDRAAAGGTVRMAAAAVALFVGLVVAAVVFWPREDKTVAATRDLLVETMEWGELWLREALVMHAIHAGVPDAEAERVASALVALQRERLALLLTHWRKDEAAREAERSDLVEREEAIIVRAKAVLAPLAEQRLRTSLLTKWTWDSSVPIRWVSPPSLQEIQRELLLGEELTEANRKLRWEHAERIARRANIDPALVRSLAEPYVRDREEVIDRFKRAPLDELKALEDRHVQLRADGRGALKAKMPANVAKAIGGALFVAVSESTEPDMWYDDAVEAD